MTTKRAGNHPSPLAAGAGLAAVALFLAGAIVLGERPPFDSSGEELLSFLEAEQTRIQVAAALDAAAVPFFICFLAAVVSMTAGAGREVRHAGFWILGCGLAFLTLFLADLTALAVSALRPAESGPEVALALRDFELIAMGIAAFCVVAMLAAAALLPLRHGVIWARWVGWIAAVAAPLYLLRVGTLFTMDGPFAADGTLGIVVPVGALLVWLVAASATLAASLGRGEVRGVDPG